MSWIWAPLSISIQVAISASALVLFFGTLFAWLLAGKRSLMTRALDFILSIPLFMPPTVLGFGVISLLGMANFGLGTILFSRGAAILAAALAGLPLYYRTVRSYFESIEQHLFEAAAVDGAAGWVLFHSIIFPLALPGISVGFLMAFLRALGEFGITMMIAGNIPGRTQTLSLAIWDAVMAGHEQRAALLAIVLAVLSLSLLMVLSVFGGEAGTLRDRLLFRSKYFMRRSAREFG